MEHIAVKRIDSGVDILVVAHLDAVALGVGSLGYLLFLAHLDGGLDILQLVDVEVKVFKDGGGILLKILR